ncbi:MAG: cell wall-active antibiotics response protein [Chlorobi bacterium]|nr:cell wall-active antibiotics response protein [Chlorobiota bacterium]
MEKTRTSNSRTVLGIVLIFFGFLLLGREFHFIPVGIRSFIFSWQVILMAVGLVFLLSRNNKSLGIVLLLIGAVFLVLDRLDFMWNMHDLFWPAVLLGLGLLILLRSGDSGRREHHFAESVSGDDYLDDVSIFGGGNKVITSQNFRGGKITSIFGGSKIDMRNAKLASGVHVLDVITIFGGTKLIVPRDWEVKTEVVSILGGFADKRISDPHIVHEPGKMLQIKGVAIFGGGEINDI